MTETNHTEEWAALQEHWEEIAPIQMRDLFAEHPERSEQFLLRSCGILLDYSEKPHYAQEHAIVTRVWRDGSMWTAGADACLQVTA